MTDRSDRTNGFKIRGFNADVDRLAVQSSVDTTWQLGRYPWGGAKWHEVALERDEIKVLRAYGAEPEIEIEGLGGPNGNLRVEATQQFTRTVRVGQRLRFRMRLNESVVIKCADWREPRTPVYAQGAV
jgi:hypothetical protein